MFLRDYEHRMECFFLLDYLARSYGLSEVIIFWYEGTH